MKTVYRCVCGKEFDSYDECLKHEKDDHIKPVLYTEHAAYYYDEDSLYPDEIEVKMADGSVISFMNDHFVEEPTEKEKPAQAD